MSKDELETVLPACLEWYYEKLAGAQREIARLTLENARLTTLSGAAGHVAVQQVGPLPAWPGRPFEESRVADGGPMPGRAEAGDETCVRLAYLRLLMREPEPEGLRVHLAVAKKSGRVAMARGIAGSAEAAMMRDLRAGPLFSLAIDLVERAGPRDLVHFLYAHALGRAPDAAALAHDAARPDDPRSRVEALLAISCSAEAEMKGLEFPAMLRQHGGRLRCLIDGLHYSSSVR